MVTVNVPIPLPVPGVLESFAPSVHMHTKSEITDYDAPALVKVALVEAKAYTDTAVRASATPQAAASAQAAGSSAVEAADSAERAESSAAAAATKAEEAEISAQQASGSEAAAGSHAGDAEAWAAGTRDGVAVGVSDEAYQNNAKWYKEQARSIAGGDFFPSKDEAREYARTAVDSHDNSSAAHGGLITEIHEAIADEVQERIDAVAAAEARAKTYADGKQAKITASGLLKGSGSAVTSAVEGTDYVGANGWHKINHMRASSRIIHRSGNNSVLFLRESDMGCFIISDTPASVFTNFQIPANETVAIPIEAECEIFRKGDGDVTFGAESGVTLLFKEGSAGKIADKNTSIVLKKIDTNVWSVQGNLG